MIPGAQACIQAMCKGCVLRQPNIIRKCLFSTSTLSSTPVSTYWNVNKNDPLLTQYQDAHDFLKSKRSPPDIDPEAVFANAELDLSQIEVYGFDYDYTLAQYKTSVEKFIHDTARQMLVDELKYPKLLLKMPYVPQSAVRGLHYDIEKGLLLKLDQFHNIQLGTVFRGRQKLDDEEVIKIYNRLKIPQNYVDGHLKNETNQKMVQLVDIFAKPAMCLLKNVIQWFLDNYVKYAPESIYLDVLDGINYAHPLFHGKVIENPSEFLDPNPNLKPYLLNLKENGKKIFLITNSPYDLVNVGMTFMCGQNWKDIFDVIIVQAKKPSFFTEKSRHFRKYVPEEKILSWQQITSFRPGQVYARGNMKELQELTNWKNEQVLYFGDHPYADLADLSLNHGWHTGAIIQELQDEIKVMNKDSYKWTVNWSTILQNLIEDNQERQDKDDRAILKDWQLELDDLRLSLKEMHNPFYGSIFRTYQNSTYFSRRLFRFADIYTSHITNLDKYSLNHVFYPRRGALPHDFRSWFV